LTYTNKKANRDRFLVMDKFKNTQPSVSHFDTIPPPKRTKTIDFTQSMPSTSK
jgi:hypothetical protein